jgi:hypothetical protein
VNPLAGRYGWKNGFARKMDSAKSQFDEICLDQTFLLIGVTLVGALTDFQMAILQMTFPQN